MKLVTIGGGTVDPCGPSCGAVGSVAGSLFASLELVARFKMTNSIWRPDAEVMQESRLGVSAR